MEEEKKNTAEHAETEDETTILPISAVKGSHKDQKEAKKLRKKNKRLQNWLIVLVVFGILGGWLLGSFFPIPGSEFVRKTDSSSLSKFSEVLNIMEHRWYFGKDISNLETRLTDQALTGMTNNSEDIHTEYMSKDAITAFTDSINRNFVGIGVQFQSTDEGIHIITRVLPDSPAEKAGVQAGDIIHAVDDKVVDGLSASEIQQLVQGEEGTEVKIDLIRNERTLTLKIKRARISSTVYGSVRSDGIGYLQIVNFGESTAEEVKRCLDDFKAQNVTKLILDLREDGGGYLDALEGVMSCFLPKNTVYIQREFEDGSVKEGKTTGENYYAEFGPIVILVDENTASAAEAFTIGMKEQRRDVTIVGTKTYGKGSVQVTQYFDDGSAIKYTNSIWKSPSGVWVNGTGITPDIEVELDPALTSTYETMEEGDSYAYDSVSAYVKGAQMYLKFLGYEIDRTDGYFDQKTEEALKQFQADHDLEKTGILDQTSYESLISAVVLEWNTDSSKDTQLQKAVEALNG